MGTHHTLGFAGGAGGKQQVGQVPRAHRHRTLAGLQLTDRLAPGEKTGPIQVAGRLRRLCTEHHQLFQAGRT